MTWRSITFVFASLAGCSAILLAAAAAHMPGIEDTSRAVIERASLYQLFHAVMLVVLALNYRPAWRFSSAAFMLGIVCFCGGIYLNHLLHMPAFGRIVPAGGISFAAGWLLLLAGIRLRG